MQVTSLRTEKIAYVESMYVWGEDAVCFLGASLSYPTLQLCFGTEVWEKAILPASTPLPMGMSKTVNPNWGDATAMQLGQSSWDSVTLAH